MPSTFTQRLRLEQQASGENDNTWGDKLNTNYSLIDELADGYLEKDVAGSSNVTLSSFNAASDESRQRVLKLTGTLTGNIDVIVPAVEKSYVVWNATAGSFTLTFKPSGGTGLVVPQGYVARVFSDGSTMQQASPWLDPTTGEGDHILWGGTSGGTSTALTLTIPGLRALRAGQLIRLIVGTTVGSNPTLNINGIGAKNLLVRGGGSSIFANELVAGEPVLALYDGTSFRVLKEIVRETVYTSDDTWNKPTGLIELEVEVGGGGGGGGGAVGTASEVGAAGGGAGGGYSRKRIKAGDLGSSEAVTVGSGGSGGAAGNNDGSAGGTSSFGSHLSATGGGQGLGSGSTTVDTRGGSGGVGGAGASGDLNPAGQPGEFGVRFGTSAANWGGNGGGSMLGGGALGPAGNSAGAAGRLYGGGGSGAATSNDATDRAGGDGADGIVIVREYY